MKETRPKGKGLMAGLAGKRTVTRTYKTPMLILCTGKHVTPYVPELPNDGSVPVIHSSQVRCAIDGFGRDVYVRDVKRSIYSTNNINAPQNQTGARLAGAAGQDRGGGRGGRLGAGHGHQRAQGQRGAGAGGAWRVAGTGGVSCHVMVPFF